MIGMSGTVAGRGMRQIAPKVVRGRACAADASAEPSPGPCRSILARLPTIGQMEAGAVTAEFALVLPTVVAIAGSVLAFGRVSVVSMDCQRAAGETVRALTVEDEAAARAVAVRIAGDGTRVSAGHDAQMACVTVTCPVMPGPMNLTPMQVAGEACAMRQ